MRSCSSVNFCTFFNGEITCLQKCPHAALSVITMNSRCWVSMPKGNGTHSSSIERKKWLMQVQKCYGSACISAVHIKSKKMAQTLRKVGSKHPTIRFMPSTSILCTGQKHCSSCSWPRCVIYFSISAIDGELTHKETERTYLGMRPCAGWVVFWRVYGMDVQGRLAPILLMSVLSFLLLFICTALIQTNFKKCTLLNPSALVGLLHCKALWHCGKAKVWNLLLSRSSDPVKTCRLNNNFTLEEFQHLKSQTLSHLGSLGHVAVPWKHPTFQLCQPCHPCHWWLLAYSWQPAIPLFCFFCVCVYLFI